MTSWTEVAGTIDKSRELQILWSNCEELWISLSSDFDAENQNTFIDSEVMWPDYYRCYWNVGSDFEMDWNKEGQGGPLVDLLK